MQMIRLGYTHLISINDRRPGHGPCQYTHTTGLTKAVTMEKEVYREVVHMTILANLYLLLFWDFWQVVLRKLENFFY